MPIRLLTTSFILAFTALANSATAAEIGAEITFSSDEAAIIRAWYSDRDGHRRPEKKNGRSLPPGIAKNLGRGKPLPPGIAKQTLPSDLVDRLPPVEKGYERVIVDGKVLLVEIATQVVHDILTDAILR
jgi:hypothetical protein